ncbi:formylglycine-generating enzyme family protein [Sphingomonas sp.]|uniref:formylglycine-generating enzyme family protein n=1 Tax=Sphingomonas sp. TaxID=28214 RepID=UPI002DD67D45|nr:SUMF1/EgtB/PvdO family nonheme iron enzyme [Sphingomonas sp.]
MALDGATPEHLSLEPVPDAAVVAGVVNNSFSPFAEASAFCAAAYRADIADAPAGTLHLIYLYGHAWLDVDAGITVSVREGPEDAIVLWGQQLLDWLLKAVDPDRAVLIFDCCHAGAFAPLLWALGTRAPRLSVFAAGANESAIAFKSERASRLSLVLAALLSGNQSRVDLVAVIAKAAESVAADGVIAGQDVDYHMRGEAIRLDRRTVSTNARRQRTVSRIRRALIGSGAVAALLVVVGAWFYWQHVVIEVDLGEISTIASNVRVVTTAEAPDGNRRTVLSEEAAQGASVRGWVPAGDVIVRVEANYADGSDRYLAFHLALSGSFDPVGKFLRLTIPATDEIEAHPGMAFIPPGNWLHERDLEKRQLVAGYWIDVRPPTVSEYTPLAEQFAREGLLGPRGSFLLNSIRNASAVDAAGFEPLAGLGKDLSDIFAVIESAESDQVTGGGDLAPGLGEIACSTCPAPMTREEAILYCTHRGKRLATDLEWELAVRGTDGRVFPWGNRIDQARANIPGLPAVGEPPPALKPVDAYPDERSPFGLVDTVGNAGDWVINTTGSYEAVYMGATYRFNPEDATSFRKSPVTDEESLIREITARCVGKQQAD